MPNTIKILFLTLAFGMLAGGCQNKSKEDPARSMDQRKNDLLARVEKKYEDPKAHYQLGKLYQSDGLWQKAEFEFTAAMGYDPTHKEAEAALVKVLLDSGNRQRSDLMAQNFISKASYSPATSLMLGRAFHKELLDDYALTCYQQALNLAPNSAGLNKQMGYYYLNKGDEIRAEEYLKRSFQLNPNQPEVAGELGRMGIVVAVPKKKESGLKIDKLIDKILKKEEKK